MTRTKKTRRPRLYSLGVVLLMAAPPCQETNPDFGGAEDGDTDPAPTSTTNPATDGPESDTTAGTSPATGDGTATTNPGTTGDPPTTTTGPASTSSAGSTTDEGSTGGCTMCGGDCVDTQTDADHCGECDNRCHPAMEQCVDSMCVPN